MISIGVALALVELACALFLPIKSLDAFSTLVDDTAVVQMKRNYAAPWKSAEFLVEVRLNRDGYREDFDFDLSDLDIAFMGDSYVFGHGVEAGERFANIFAARFPRRRIASLSYANGWQPEHYEYFLRKNPSLRPSLLVVALYLGNDLDSDIRETKVAYDESGFVERVEIPSREVFDGYMITRGLYPLGLGELAKHSRAARLLLGFLSTQLTWRDYLVERNPGRYPPNSPNALETDLGALDTFGSRAMESLARIRSLVATRGGEFAVLIIPQNYYVTSTANPHIAREHRGRTGEIVRGGGLKAQVLRRCAREELTCFDPTALLTEGDYFELDGHWTRAAHRKVGLWLAQELAAVVAPRK